MLRAWLKKSKKAYSMRSYAILLRYLFSSLIIFMLPFLLFGLLAFNSAVDKLNAEVEAAYAYKLEQITSDMEEQFDNIQINSIRIVNDTNLKPYNISKNISSEIDAIKELKKYKENAMIAEECIVYFKGWNEIYTSSGKYINDIFTNHIIDFKNWRDIFTDLENSTVPFVRPQESIKMNSQGIWR